MLTRAAMQFYRHRYWRPTERKAGRPDLAQAAVLRALLLANRETTFGKAHGFADIRDPRHFGERVPVQHYDTLRPYIDEQRRTGAPALTAESPVFYAQTSGTTGTPKYIPITPTALTIHRAEQALFSYLQYRACPDAFGGQALGIMGAAVEGRLDSGHDVGSVSGHLYASLPRFVQSRFVVPPAVAGIKDYDLKYQVILHLALARPGITYIGSPNPSTFVRLLDILNSRREAMLRALASGTADVLAAIEPSLARLVASRMTSSPSRAAKLQQLPELTFANVWPDLRLVTTWTGGSCGIALGALRKKLPAGAMVMELGYQATECRGTIPLEAESAGGLPPLGHHFFEFVEQGAWDRGNPAFQTLGDLEAGRRYYVLITTAAGLYRYFMNDLVEVTARFRQTPLLRFVQKGKGVTSLTGEKLYEAQAIDAIQAAFSEHGMTPSFFMLVANEEPACYRLLVERCESWTAVPAMLPAAVDRHLGKLNIEYRSKRDSGRLGAPTVVWLKQGAAEAYKAASVRAGQREGQLKPAVLQYQKDLILGFDEYIVRDPT